MRWLLLVAAFLFVPLVSADAVEPLRLTLDPKQARADDDQMFVPVRDLPESNAAAGWMRVSVLLARHAAPFDDVDSLATAPREALLAIVVDDARVMADSAVRGGTAEWGYGEPLMGTLLPELQELRHLAKMLSAESTLATRDGLVLRPTGVFGDRVAVPGTENEIAATQAQAFRIRAALAEDLKAAPAYVAASVGARLHVDAFDDFARAMERPGSRNYYHALAAARPGSVPMRRMAEDEWRSIYASLPGFKRVRGGGEVTPAEFARLADHVATLAFVDRNGVTRSADMPGSLALFAWGTQWHRARGASDAELRAMSPAQRTASAMVAEYDAHFEKLVAASEGLTPFATAVELALLHRAVERRAVNPIFWFAFDLSDAPIRLHHPHRQRALLMAVEALRHHVAVHGELPATLDDAALPIPPDPITGLPIGYEITEAGFTLTPPSTGPIGRPRVDRPVIVTLRPL